MNQTAKLTISLPKNLASFADEVATEKRISRSKVVSDCLEEYARRRKLAEMEEGYKAMANEHKKFAKMTEGIMLETVPEWK